MGVSPLFRNQIPFAVKRETLEQIFPDISTQTLRVLSGHREVRDEHQEIILRPQYLAQIETELGAGRKTLSIGRSGKNTLSLQGLTREGVIRLLSDKTIRIKRTKKTDSAE